MPKDEWSKNGKNWKYYKHQPRSYWQPSIANEKKQRIPMPWGQFKGRYLDSIPTYYLEWLLTVEGCKPEWKPEIRRVMAFRKPSTAKDG